MTNWAERARKIAHDHLTRDYNPCCVKGEDLEKKGHDYSCNSLQSDIEQALQEAYDAGRKGEAAAWELSRINQELGLDESPMYATCDCCNQVMKPGTACTDETYDDFVGRGPVKRIPSSEPENCHDCGAPPGGLHHVGCDREMCPVCRGQLISCDCEVKEVNEDD